MGQSDICPTSLLALLEAKEDAPHTIFENFKGLFGSFGFEMKNVFGAKGACHPVNYLVTKGQGRNQ